MLFQPTLLTDFPACFHAAPYRICSLPGLFNSVANLFQIILLTKKSSFKLSEIEIPDFSDLIFGLFCKLCRGIWDDYKPSPPARRISRDIQKKNGALGDASRSSGACQDCGRGIGKGGSASAESEGFDAGHGRVIYPYTICKTNQK